MNILLIDDHTLFREGLKFLLSDLNKNITFFEANALDQALSFKNSVNMDLILLDYYLPDSNDFGSITKIRNVFSDTSIVVLSGEEDPKIIHSSINSGASGFIPKSSNQNILVAALNLILAGGIYLPPHVLSNFTQINDPDLQNITTRSTKNISNILTKKQYEALLLAVKGKPNKLIAREMNISVGTVKAHLSNSFQILGVKNRTEAVYTFAANGDLSNSNKRNI